MNRIARFFGILIFGFLVVSCNNKSDKEIVKNLNGYWKIHQVEEKDGDVREYKVSTSIDYIEVDSTMEGYRIKVQPQIDSTFKMANNPEYFSMQNEDDSLRFHYKTQLDNWKETLISSDKDEFTVKNERGLTFTYKRFESLKKELEGHE